MKFILKHENDYHWFVLVASNGQIYMTSETYTRKASAVKSMKKIANRMADVRMYDKEGNFVKQK